MKRHALIFGTLLGSALLLTQCGDPATEDTNITDTPDTDTSEVVVEVDETAFDFLLPSPLQVASMLDGAGVDYDPSLLNGVESSSNYNTNSHKLLNFGTYSADMAYCVMNEDSETALSYLQVISDMSDDLGLSSVFQTEDLVSSFENNASNPDTLLNILITVQERLDDYVDENDERFMHVVIMTGAWSEFMYIGSNATGDETSVNHQLAEQMTLLGNLIRGLSTNPNEDARISSLVVALTELKDTYEGFDSVNSIDEDSGVPVLSAEEIAQVSTKVEQIRKSIVEG